MKQSHFLKVGASFLFWFCLFPAHLAAAQESPREFAGYQWGGAIEAGYRFTDIHGKRRYQETVNLDEGPRLFDFNVWVKDLEKQGIADEARVRLNNIGDPYPSARLDVKKNNVYQFSVDYREFDFFSNRRDFPGDFDFSNTLLTDNHDFDQKRRIGTVNLALFPAAEVRLNFGFSFAQRTGEAGVPRIFTFVPNLSQSLDEIYKEYFGSVDFPLGQWDIHIKQSYWTFDNRNEIDQFPILAEKRDESVWTYSSTVKAHTSLTDRWDMDAAYVYAHSRGDSRLELNRSVPVQVDPGSGDIRFDTHILEFGLSHLLIKDVILHLDYRFHTFEQDGETNTDLFALPQKLTTTHYSLFANTATPQLEYTPWENLSLRAGYQFQYRSIEAENFARNEFDGGQHSERDNLFSHGWVASADWKPSKSWSLFGEYAGDAVDNPYIRISPQAYHTGKIRIRYDTPVSGLNFRGTVLWKQKTNPDQAYRLDIQDYGIAATYQPAALPNLVFDAAYTFERIQDKKSILNQEGLFPPPPPALPIPLFSDFTFDSDAHIFSAGISYEGIYKGLGAGLSGSYARTAKENSQEYSVLSLKCWYKNKWLIPIVAFERYELEDFERPSDSFSANLVTLSLRKEF